jgi:hypothetical protein
MPRTPRDELADATAHGEVYLRWLRRRQLVLSLMALTVFGALIGILPLALDLLPSLRHHTLLTVPLADWLLVLPLPPLFLAIALIYERRADALDESFSELVERR